MSPHAESAAPPHTVFGVIRGAGQRPLGLAAVALAVGLSTASFAGCSSASTTESSAQGTTAPPSTSATSTTTTAARHRAAPRPRRPRRHAPSPIAGLSVSSASSSVVQPQPPPGSCHTRGSGLFSLPDPRCTPGAISSAVTQANIQSTICSYGYTETVRPPESITEPEKEASLAAYGDSGPLHDYEYDHLVPLELGGAPNDPRNLWPERGASPNPKDAVEDRLRQDVCDGRMTLPHAQRAIATNWVALAHPRNSASPSSQAKPPSTSAAMCSATAQYNSHYGDWDVYVHSNQPDQTVTVSGGGETRTWRTDSSGYADVYFYAGRSAAGEQITVRVGAAACTTTL